MYISCGVPRCSTAADIFSVYIADEYAVAFLLPWFPTLQVTRHNQRQTADVEIVGTNLPRVKGDLV